MFNALIVGLAVLATVDSAQFKFDVDAPAGVVVVLKVEGREIKPGKVYETAPFLGERTLAFEVTWTEAGVTRAAAGTFLVKAGYVAEMEFRTPREYIGRRPVD
mgnify:CR=1 FL=1